MLRGNNFELNNIGINPRGNMFRPWGGGEMNLSPLPDIDGRSCNYGTIIFGKNSFSTDNYESKWDGNTNNKIDISIDNSMIWVRDGYNRFDASCQYHLGGNIGPIYGGYVPVRNNSWEDPNGYKVRHSQNVPISEEEYLDQYLTDYVGCETSCTGSGGGGGSGLSNLCSFSTDLNYGNWAELDPTSNNLDSYFNSSVNFMMNDSNPTYCRREKASDAMQAAFQNDSNFSMLRNLKNYFDVIISRGSQDTLCCTAKLFKGYVHEMLNEYDSTLIYFNNIITNYPGTSDSVHAFFGIKRINYETSDSSHGETFDSLRAIYYNDWLDHFINMTPETPHVNDVEENMADSHDDFILKIINRNFADQQIDIIYQIKESGDVNISLFDILGNKVETIVDGTILSGSHIKSLYKSVKQGLYLCVMRYKNKAILEKIVLFY
jgi:hypothetical protein